ncbi:GDP-L-fucose synthase family protein [Thermodesulfobacteriota bacterium]
MAGIVHKLKAEGYTSIVTRPHSELDLIDQRSATDFFQAEKIEAVVLAAAKVGGIHANNTYRADFIYQNLMIQCNVIHAAFKAGVEQLLFLGSSCIYPQSCPQPIKEDYLLSGYLEPTNEPYAVAKIAGIKLCESYNRQHGTKYRVVMPTNLFGPRDNYDLETSHVLPAMIRKFHLGKLASNKDWDGIAKDEQRFGKIPADIKQALGIDPQTSGPSTKVADQPNVKLWGSGTPRREFLHVDDMAAACLFVMKLSEDQYAGACAFSDRSKEHTAAPVSHINVGCGEDISIRDLAGQISEIVGFEGQTAWDSSKPDGTPRKMLDVSRLTGLGWQPQIGLKEGIQKTYKGYVEL